MQKDKIANLVKNLALLTIVLIICLGVSEMAVRWLCRDVMSTSDNTSYFCLRGYKRNVRYNSLGYREKEFELKKPEGVYRIAAMGDSFTFGQGIAEKERFSNLLEKMLGTHPGKYELLNFGVPGHNTVDHVETLKKMVLETNPDFILLQWYHNDFENREVHRLRYWPMIPNYWLRKQLHKHSALYYLANKQWQLIQEKLGMAKYNYLDDRRKRLGRPDSEEIKAALKLFEEIFRVCETNHTKIGVVLFPDFTVPLDDKYPFDYFHRYVVEICQRENVPYLDLFEKFASYKDEKALWANRLDAHPGRDANLIAAQAIMDAFGNIWTQGANNFQ